MSRGDGLDRLRQALDDHGCKVQGTSAQCPGPGHANGDRRPSLSIGQGERGAVLTCHAGCRTEDVLAALGLGWGDLFDDPAARRRGWDVAATYTYTDQHGEPLYFVQRRVPKDFRAYRMENGRKVWSLNGTRRVPYRLPQVLEAARAGGTVYICEGEKDAGAIEAAGATATCNPGGAGKWPPQFARFLAGAGRVVVVADRDPPGYAHAAQVAASVREVVPDVTVVEAASGKDYSDHAAAGHGLGDLRPVTPAEEESSDAIRTSGGDPAAGPGDGAETGPGAIAARYTPVDWHAAWAAQPDETDWLIEPLLEVGTVNAWYGKPGSGKSLLALEQCLRLVRAGHAVVYVDEENRVADLVERLQAFGAEPGELGRLVLYSFAGLPPLDSVVGGVTLEALAVTAGASLVVLDTTSRMVQGKENDSDTFLQLYRCSLVPLKKKGVTVLRLDHEGKDPSRGQRGSSAKDGDVDTVWRLTKHPDQVTFTFERTKGRNGHGDGLVTMRRRHDPLRHEWAARDLSAPARIIRRLDELGVAPDAGRDRCRTALADAGVKVSNAQLTAALRVRKTCPGQVADRPDGSASVAACPSVPPSGTDRRTAPVPDGPAVPPPVLCAVCRTPMNPALAEAGKRAHPNCDPEGETQP